MDADPDARFAIEPVLELADARPRFDEGGLSSVRYNLRLNRGDCALIECRDARQTALFADLCTGLVPLDEGHVKCMGLDWQTLEEKRAWALRGRIGRMTVRGGWIGLYGTHMNILWPRLHHTRVPLDVLVEEAVTLGIQFGLPGLPTLPPDRLSSLDLKRAECVRAFLGGPGFLLLEHPIHNQPTDLYMAFLSSLTEAQERGCAIIWIAPDASVWRDYAQSSMLQLRLNDDGLFTMRGA